MATIRNQRNSDQVVLHQDVATLNRELAAACALGSLYLPSVSGFMFFRPSRMHGRKHGTTGVLEHATAKHDRLVWSGTLGQSGPRASSVTTVN
jgi:hypothetical protein